MNPFNPNSYRSTAPYLSDVPQISDELVTYFRKDRAPPDDVAERGEQRIKEACAVLQRKRREAVGTYEESFTKENEHDLD